MKWYDQILQSVKSLFKMDPEASEAEVHAALEGTPTREALEASIRTELETELTNAHQQALQERDDLIAQLNARIAELEADNHRLTTDNEQLRERVPEQHTELDKAGAITVEGGTKQLDSVTQREHEKYLAWKKAQERKANTNKA